jgi:hypothetical protein
MSDPRIRWAADASRVAHAFHAGAPRSLCGQVVRHDERRDWPARVRCGRCVEAVAGVAR